MVGTKIVTHMAFIEAFLPLDRPTDPQLSAMHETTCAPPRYTAAVGPGVIPCAVKSVMFIRAERDFYVGLMRFNPNPVNGLH